MTERMKLADLMSTFTLIVSTPDGVTTHITGATSGPITSTYEPDEDTHHVELGRDYIYSRVPRNLTLRFRDPVYVETRDDRDPGTPIYDRLTWKDTA